MYRFALLVVAVAYGIICALLFSVETAVAAQITFDLQWRDTSTSTLAFNSIGEISANTGNGCPVIGGSGSLDGYCLDVVVTATVPFSASTATLGWSTADSGMTAPSPPSRAFETGTYGSSFIPVYPAFRASTECTLTNCDTAVGSFGSISLSNQPTGTYTVGSLSFDLTGIGVGTHEIQPFFVSGVDGAVNASYTYLSTEFNGAVVNVVPEPETALLLGLGLSVLDARRKTWPRISHDVDLNRTP